MHVVHQEGHANEEAHEEEVHVQRITSQIHGRTSQKFDKPMGLETRTVQDERVAELADIIRTYRGIEIEETEKEYHWYDGPGFDMVMCTIILLNILIIGLEMDYAEGKVGYERMPLWICLEWLFCIIFCMEIGIKIYFHHERGPLTWYHDDNYSWISTIVAVMAFTEVVVLGPMKIRGLRMISLVRIINLLRLRRVIEKEHLLKELKLVLRGMIGSWVSLFWAMVVMMLIYFVFAIWTTTLIGHNEGYHNLKRRSNGWDNEELFGTILKSMFSLMQVMTQDTWCSGLVRHIADQNWYMCFVFFAFSLLTTYGIMHLIVSLIVEQTIAASGHSETRQKAREERQRNAEASSCTEIFMLADLDGNGDLTLAEFLEAVETDAEVQYRFRQMGLELDAAKRLFQVIDGDGERSLKKDEFIDGCTKLKGYAKSKDLLALQHQADSMACQMNLLGAEVQDSERMLARLDDATKRMTSRFGPTVISSRRALVDRDRGAAPHKPMEVERAGAISANHLASGNVPRLPHLPNLVD